MSFKDDIWDPYIVHLNEQASLKPRQVYPPPEPPKSINGARPNMVIMDELAPQDSYPVIVEDIRNTSEGLVVTGFFPPEFAALNELPNVSIRSCNTSFSKE